jgi:hypothetical protein
MLEAVQAADAILDRQVQFILQSLFHDACLIAVGAGLLATEAHFPAVLTDPVDSFPAHCK